MGVSYYLPSLRKPLAGAMVLAIALAGVPAAGIRPAVAQGPESVADLAEGLLDAVVNISTSQKVQQEEEGSPSPTVPDGSPFQELFEDFFKGEGRRGGNQKVNSLGSGFVIDEKGIVVTNNHVIEGADAIEVIFADGSSLPATLVGTDPKTDLSVLKVEPTKPLKAVKFGDSTKIRIGDWVMAIGNPFGLGGSVTVGIVSARGRNINAGPYDNFIQTDAAINKGNSGGPLFNMDGEVIGINTAIISPSGGSIGIGFAVPTELAANIVNQLSEFGETRRGWLGVRIQPVTDEVAKSLNLEKAGGAMIAGIIEGGPITNGEMKPGDVIVSFNGKTVNDTRDLQRIVAESPIGAPVEARVLRDGKEEAVQITLGRLEDQETASVGKADDAPTDDSAASAPDAGSDADANADSVAVLGMTLAYLDDDSRKTYGIGEGVDGLVITEVSPGSGAEKAGLKVGEVVVEIAQEFMATPSDASGRVDALKKEGRRSAHMMIAGPDGNLRFVGVLME
ncbi:Do family serine endopeptidase [Rhizobiaceae bacterium BDR2-2]|uniref:Probable periplasmic serine endoprotease DegP-like n=1 Tax=Ectorhizobium quercum TaxID=2965071 RepID=A0AAE3SUZ2_9HYPH|nr:Do family serine endopeptidase [Ectorhizobium quercum]MCX8996414.1 Do family serine endopeptidase [Ectorhizobium quercum]